jgi:drug/metabolite transporter (DMT)-like permease
MLSGPAFLQNFLFYVITTLAWGSTWYAIKFQLGHVPLELSIGYRFALASLILFGWCILRKVNLKFSRKSHSFFILQGIFLFSLNYFFAYEAAALIPSGINAVVFSIVLIFNMLNSFLFYRLSLNPKLIMGALLGISGVLLIFWPQISTFNLSSNNLKGMLLSLLGSAIASWGTMISMRNQQHHLPVMQTNAYAMGYGAILTFLLASFKGHSFSFDWTLPYIGSLFYLSIVGSVIAFGCYLTLVGQIGPVRASYIMLITPVVALIISTFLESFKWESHVIFGAGLISLGNLIILGRKKLSRKDVT